MNNVYIISDNIISSLGFTTDDNISNIIKNNIGIKYIKEEDIFASLIDENNFKSSSKHIENTNDYTKFEKLVILSIKDALDKTSIDAKSAKTLFILATTNGNFDLIDESNNNFDKNRIYLWQTASVISKYFGNSNTPIVISNSSVSSVSAIITGSRMIRSRMFDNIIISGADVLTKNIILGYNSINALGKSSCLPFDMIRDGISLGEAAGTIILSSEKKSGFVVGGDFISNDAASIISQSKTGDGLLHAIQKTLNDINSSPEIKLDFINTHGSGSYGNDEMESVAITRAGLKNIPINSFKGYFGHTLGASGIIESIVCIHSIKKNILFKTAGFEAHNFKNNITIIDKHKEINLSKCLKTSSGYGGMNAGITFIKL